MANIFTEDRNLLWVCLPLSGTPDRWRPDKNYKIGDIVIPRFPALDQMDIMFQVVGFIGKSSGVEPTWPVVEDNTVKDGNIEWIARDPDKSPAQIPNKEYYLIDSTITVST